MPTAIDAACSQLVSLFSHFQQRAPVAHWLLLPKFAHHLPVDVCWFLRYNSLKGTQRSQSELTLDVEGKPRNNLGAPTRRSTRSQSFSSLQELEGESAASIPRGNNKSDCRYTFMYSID